MRLADFVITAAAVAGLSGTALAQTPATAPPAPTNPVANTGYNSTGDHWIASAFVGSNFGSGRTGNLAGIDTDSNSTSINFGGQAAYLWGGYVGAEALVDFAPSFEINNLLFQDNPTVNTYMANGIAAVPIGSENRFLPYFSGGIGAVQMRSTIFTADPATAVGGAAIDTLSASGSRFGGDVGGGIMGFSGSWGFRGDLRYYKTSVDNNVDLTDLGNGNVFTQSVLSGLAFWKANVGVAFRW
jgi:hypothetical protein